MKYAEQPLDLEGHIDLLAQRGLQVEGRSEALQALRHTDPLLFRGHCLLLEASSIPEHSFRNGASFEQLLEFHRFDGAFSLLLLHAIRSIEASLRAQWSRHPSLAYGPLFYLNPAHFKEGLAKSGGKKWRHRRALAVLRRSYKRSRNPAVIHFVRTYQHPPAWAVAGTMSLGQLARWYDALGERAMHEKIAHTYGLSGTLLSGFLPGLSQVRNICAHHEQLYGRKIPAYPRPPRKPAALHDSYGKRNDGRIYNILVFIAYLLGKIEERQREEFVRGVQRLFGQYRGINPDRLGFPAGWWLLPVWRL